MDLGKFTTVCFLLQLCLSNSFGAKRIPPGRFAGPYSISVRGIGNLSSDYQPTGQMWAQVHFTPPNSNHKQYAWGEVYTNMDFSNDLKIDIRIAQWKSDRWVKNAFIIKLDNACSSGMLHAEGLLKLLFGEISKCPIPKQGLREIRNQTFELAFPQFPVFPYGRWLFTLAILKGKEVLGGGVAEGDTMDCRHYP